MKLRLMHLAGVLGMAAMLWGCPLVAADAVAVGIQQLQGDPAPTLDESWGSEAEVQAYARNMMIFIIVLAVFVLVGTTIVVGVALYGAHRKFGVPGLLGVGLVAAFVVLAMLGMMVTVFV